MRKGKRQKDKKQMELSFQSKELTQTVKPNKSAKSVKAKRSNTGLSKKSTKSKVKEITCGHKQPSGVLFENLITTEELAVIFRVSSQTIRNWVARGKIPHVQIGRRNLFHMGSLQQWLNRKEEPLWE